MRRRYYGMEPAEADRFDAVYPSRGVCEWVQGCTQLGVVAIFVHGFRYGVDIGPLRMVFCAEHEAEVDRFIAAYDSIPPQGG